MSRRTTTKTSITKKAADPVLKDAQVKTTVTEVIEQLNSSIPSITKIAKNMDFFSVVQTMRKKRKQLDDYLNYEGDLLANQEFREAAKQLSEIHRGGKQANSEEVGRLYSILAKNIEDFERLKNGSTKNIDSVKNPISHQEMDRLVDLVSEHPSIRAKKLKKEDLKKIETKFCEQLSKKAKELEVLKQRAASLAKELRSWNDFAGENEDIYKQFIAYCRSIIQDVSVKQSYEKAGQQNVEAQFERLSSWLSEKTKIVNSIITGCVCTLKLKQDIPEDDVDDYKRLFEMAKKNLDGVDVSELIHPNMDVFCPQDYPILTLPFNPKFVINEGVLKNDKDAVFLGQIYCSTVTLPKDSPVIPALFKYTRSISPNSHIYIPKPFAVLYEGDNIIILFESCPSFVLCSDPTVPGLISNEHKKAMLMGYAKILHDFAEDNILAIFPHVAFRVTNNCQFFIAPTFLKILIHDPKNKPDALSSRFTIDTVYRPNANLVSLGYLIDVLIFGKVPEKIDATRMELPLLSSVNNQFMANARELLMKLYVPNGTMTNRPVRSGVDLVSTLVPYGGLCHFHMLLPTENVKDVMRTNLKNAIDEMSSSGARVNLGTIDRGLNPTLRLKNYISTMAASPYEGFFSMFKFQLNGESGIGMGPVRSLILDFFDLLFKHPVFRNANGKWIFEHEKRPCEACNSDGCSFFNDEKTYVVIGRMMLSCLAMKCQIPKKIALFTLDSILANPPRPMTLEMCHDIYPMSKELLKNQESMGPVQMIDGEIQHFSISNVKEPFGIPNMVPLVELGEALMVPISMVGHYLMDRMTMHVHKTMNFSTWVRKGLGEGTGKSPWVVITNIPTLFFSDLVCNSDENIDADLLFKKINFTSGFSQDGTNTKDRLRAVWFKEFLSKEENNHLRVAFLKEATATPYIPVDLPDASIQVGVDSGLTVDYRTQTCTRQFFMRNVQTKEELEGILLNLVYSGTDYYNSA